MDLLHWEVVSGRGLVRGSRPGSACLGEMTSLVCSPFSVLTGHHKPSSLLNYVSCEVLLPLACGPYEPSLKSLKLEPRTYLSSFKLFLSGFVTAVKSLRSAARETVSGFVASS